jgi:hypothetical protein
MAEKSKRLQLDVTPGFLRSLDAVKKQMHAASRAETVRNAVWLLREVARRKRAGERIYVGRNKDDVVELSFWQWGL